MAAAVQAHAGWRMAVGCPRRPPRPPAPARRLTPVACRVSETNEGDDRRKTVPSSGKTTGAAPSVASVALIVAGTSIGSGVVSLPGHTAALGVPLSTAALFAAWCLDFVGVLLVAELACAFHARAMEDAQAGCSPPPPTFADLVRDAAGEPAARAFTAGLHGLTYALLVCCVAGLARWGAANLGAPYSVGVLGACTAAFAVATGRVPFRFADAANRALVAACLVALAGAAAPLLVGGGAGSQGLVHSYATVPPRPLEAAAPALPLAVLTFGFHIVTPYAVGLLRGDVRRAVAALAAGGAVPLLLGSAWNAAALVIVETRTGLGVGAPKEALDALRNPEALFAALGAGFADSAAPQLFLLGALGSTLVAYALAFPLQLLRREASASSSTEENKEGKDASAASNAQALLALVPPAVLALAVPSAFDLALRVGGNFVNGALFGLAPPVLAHLSRAKFPDSRRLVPGGDATLVAVFAASLAVMLAGA